jgi:uncharacterized membrane protein YsdA (DUF1294 family)
MDDCSDFCDYSTDSERIADVGKQLGLHGGLHFTLAIRCLTTYSRLIMQLPRTRARRFSARLPESTRKILEVIGERTGRNLTEIVELLILQEGRKKTIKRSERSR